WAWTLPRAITPQAKIATMAGLRLMMNLGSCQATVAGEPPLETNSAPGRNSPWEQLSQMRRAESKSLLFWQADLLPQNLRARIATKKRKLLITIKELTYSYWPPGSHAIESFQCAVFVAKTGEDQRLFVRVLRCSRHLLGLLASAGARISVS